MIRTRSAHMVTEEFANFCAANATLKAQLRKPNKMCGIMPSGKCLEWRREPDVVWLTGFGDAAETQENLWKILNLK